MRPSRSFLIAGGIVLAGLLAAASTPAFVRTTPASGLCLWWGTRTVTYWVNDFTINPAPSVCASLQSDASAVTQAVQKSFATWTGVTAPGSATACSDLQLQFAGTTPSTVASASDGRNTIVFRHADCSTRVPAGDACYRRGSCADDYNCWDHDNILALTSVFYDTSNGQIRDADIELNSWEGGSSGTYFTCVDPIGAADAPTNACPGGDQPWGGGGVNCIYMDVQNIVTHEIGHFLGLAHDPDPTTTMYASGPPYEVTKRDLAQSDIDGVCTIYPAGRAAVTCGTTPPATDGGSAKSGGGCSSAGFGSSAALMLAPVLLLRRRRAATDR